MAKFSYSARTKEGKLQKGEIEAGSRGNVVDMLHSRGLVVVNIEEGSGMVFSAITQMNIGGVPLEEKVVFMRQLSTMISAGLPLLQSLEILSAQAQNAVFKKALKEVVSSVEGGLGLADSFEKQEGVFDDVTINLVRAGEESGNLDEMFVRLADKKESDRDFRSKVQGAMTYPAMIVVAIVLVVALLLMFMVPQMTELYEEFDAPLPAVTQFLVIVSNILVSWWWLVAAIIGVLVFSFISYRRSPGGREVTDRLILTLPVFGKLTKDVQTAEFARTAEMLIKSGLPITEALEMVADSLSNVIFSNAVKKSAQAIEKGVPMSKPISQEENFPLIVSQMIAVGEETGKVDVILSKLAEYFTAEVNHTVNNLTKLLEPIILLVMSGVVGFIALAVYLPIYNLGNVIG